MNVRAVVRVEIVVEYELGDESRTFAQVVEEQVPRAVAHVCSLVTEGQRRGVAPGVRFGVAPKSPTVTCLIVNPAAQLEQ